MDQEQFLSYWTTETGWRTELQLRSNLLNRDLTVTPVLRTPDGGETQLSPVVIKGKEVQSLDLNTLIGILRHRLSQRMARLSSVTTPRASLIYMPSP